MRRNYIITPAGCRSVLGGRAVGGSVLLSQSHTCVSPGKIVVVVGGGARGRVSCFGGLSKSRAVATRFWFFFFPFVGPRYSASRSIRIRLCFTTGFRGKLVPPSTRCRRLTRPKRECTARLIRRRQRRRLSFDILIFHVFSYLATNIILYVCSLRTPRGLYNVVCVPFSKPQTHPLVLAYARAHIFCEQDASVKPCGFVLPTSNCCGSYL